MSSRVSTQENVADIFTKALPREMHEKFTKAMSLWYKDMVFGYIRTNFIVRDNYEQHSFPTYLSQLEGGF
jgi:hypothetical protein